MNSIKTYISTLGRGVRTVILALAVVFVSAGIAQAATTISTNVSTGGTLGVTGLSSLGQASTTIFSATGISYFGGTATSTFSAGGALALIAGLTGTTASFTSTLGVTGSTTLTSASTTWFSALTKASFGSTATSSFNSAGALTLVGALSGTSGTFSTTLGVTGATTLTASTTVGTATLFAGSDMNRVGVGTTTPLDIFMVEHQTATTTVVISTGAATKGGRIILEDIDGAGCTEVSALNGTLTAITVTCPTGI